MEVSSFNDIYLAKELFGEDFLYDEKELLLDINAEAEVDESLQKAEEVEESAPSKIIAEVQEEIKEKEKVPATPIIQNSPEPVSQQPVQHMVRNREGIRDRFVAYYKDVVANNPCPLYRRGKSFIFGAGNLNELDVMILFSKPNEHDEENIARPMTSKSGKYVLSKLVGSGVNLKRSFIAPIIKCRPEYNELTSIVKEANVKITLNQIEIAHPPLIVIFGLDLALNLIKSVPDSVDLSIKNGEFLHNLRNRVITMKNGYRAIVTYDYEEIVSDKVKHNEFLHKDLPFIVENYKRII